MASKSALSFWTHLEDAKAIRERNNKNNEAERR